MGEIEIQATPNDQRLYGSAAAVKQVGISLRQLYYWIGVMRFVRPQVQQHGRRRYIRLTDADIQRLQEVKELLDDGFTLRAAMKRIREQWHA